MKQPWEIHQKTLIDTLFDCVISLPDILHRTDILLRHNSSEQLRYQIDTLLQSCFQIEQALTEWFSIVMATISQYASGPSSAQSSPRSHTTSLSTSAVISTGASTRESPNIISSDLNDYMSGASYSIPTPNSFFWTQSQGIGVETQFPFQDVYAFKDGYTSLAFIHYWTLQIVLFRCISQLCRALAENTQEHILTPYHTSPSSYQTSIQKPHLQNVFYNYGIPTSTPMYSMSTQSDSAATISPVPDMLSMCSATSQSPPIEQILEFQPHSICGIESCERSQMTNIAINSTHHDTGHTPVLQSFTPSPLMAQKSLGENVGLHFGVSNIVKYSDQYIKETADRVCSSLGFTLVHSTASLHPDFLAWPLTILEKFYKDLQSSGHYTDLEISWCGWFRGRIIQRKQEIEQNIIGQKNWVNGGCW